MWLRRVLPPATEAAYFVQIIIMKRKITNMSCSLLLLEFNDLILTKLATGEPNVFQRRGVGGGLFGTFSLGPQLLLSCVVRPTNA